MAEVLGGLKKIHLIINPVSGRGVVPVEEIRSKFNVLEERLTVHETKPDLSARTIAEEAVSQGVDFIEEQVSNGGKVYIHCWEGLGRSATMAAAYFVSQGNTVEQAWAHIKKRRSFVRPTPVQTERLEEFSLHITNGD
jgi:protein-tyrosine phosphatase